MSSGAEMPEDPDSRPPDIWENWMRIPWRIEFVEAMKRTGNLSAAAETARISRNHVYRSMREENDFAEAVAEAREEAMDLLERVAWQRATVGQKIITTKTTTGPDGIRVETTETTKISDALLQFLLRGGRPEKYRDNVQVVHSGKGGQPIVVQVERERSPERLAELLEIAADLGWTPQQINRAPIEDEPDDAEPDES